MTMVSSGGAGGSRQGQSSSPLTLSESRQSKVIADLVAHGQFEQALESCNKISQSKGNRDVNGLILSLKGLAILGLKRVKEAEECADRAGQVGGTYLYSLLRSLGQWDKLVQVLETDGLDTFPALVEAVKWKQASSVAFQGNNAKDKRSYWGLVALTRAAQVDQDCLDTLKRLVEDWEGQDLPEYKTEYECYAKVQALQAIGKTREGLDILCSVQGSKLCRKSLLLELLRSKWNRDLGNWQSLHDLALERIQGGDDNWQWISDLLVSSTELNRKKELEEFLVDRASKRPEARTSSLALMTYYEDVKDFEHVRSICENHFARFGTKPVCYEDLKVIARLPPDFGSRFMTFTAKSMVEMPSSAQEVVRRINVMKLRQWLGRDELVATLFSQYQSSLSVGKSLARTELQPADDFALMAAHNCVRTWSTSKRYGALFTATTILETLLLRSPSNFQGRLLLIRCYMLLAAPQNGLAHFEKIGIRGVQHDSLSYFVSIRLSNICAHKAEVEELLRRSLPFYESAKADLPGLMMSAFENGTYSNIPDFSEFQTRLDWSVERGLKWIELFELELVAAIGPGQALKNCHEILDNTELMRIVSRATGAELYDNRDFGLLNTFRSQDEESIEMTTRPGMSDHTTIKSFVNMYLAMGKNLEPVKDTNNTHSIVKMSTNGINGTDELSFDHVHALYSRLVYLLGLVHQSASKGEENDLTNCLVEVEATYSSLAALVDRDLRQMDKECLKYGHLTAQSISLLLKSHLLISLQPSLLSSSGYAKLLPKPKWTTLTETMRRIVKQATGQIKMIRPLCQKVVEDLKSNVAIEGYTNDAKEIGINENLAHQFAMKCRTKQADNLELLVQVIKARTK